MTEVFPVWMPATICIVELILLYFLTRVSITQLFIFLRRITKNVGFVNSVIAFIFFPGTVLHEFAHFIVAVVLLLKVRKVSLFPEWQHHYIKLGSVTYEKADFIRGILVGIAPIFAGIAFFWMIAFFQVFSTNNIGINILMGYIIFTISSTMFSSKQDLVDLVYVLPLLIIIALAIFIFKIDVVGLLSPYHDFYLKVNTALYMINIYTIISIGIHIGIVVILKLVNRNA
jgi:hypothetical protein